MAFGNNDACRGPVNVAVITLNPMDNNPYQSPRGNPSSQPELRDCDRDQCPTCLHRQKIWKAINVVGRYCCPKCSAPLVVRLGKRHRPMSLAVALAIGIPAIVMFFFVNKTNMTFVSTYSTCSTFLLVALGTFYFPWRFGYLERK